MSPKPDIRKAIASIEDHLFTGLLKRARRELAAVLDRRGLEREVYWELASLARLADMPDRGVKLLFRVVHPPQGQRSTATELEQAIYAQCLNEIGSTNEAFKILEGLQESKLPRVLLYRALCLINRSDWNAAIPLLTRLCTHPAALSYEKVAGRVWLAGALVHGPANMPRARKLLTEALHEATPDFGRVLHKHAKRFLIESLVATGQLSSAELELASLAKITADDEDPYFSIFVRQQTAVIAFANNGDKNALNAKLRRVMLDYQQLQYWEDARGCEFTRAVRTGDTKELQRLYVGTPFEPFRAKIRALDGGAVAPGANFNWQLGESGAPTGFVNVADASSSFNSLVLAPGSLTQRLLEALTIDLYRPQRITELHERLHPGEYFNPSSSPDRIHQLLKRLRSWLTRARIPLVIFEQSGLYELRTAKTVTLRLAADRANHSVVDSDVIKLQPRLAKIRAAFVARNFTAREVSSTLRCSQPTAVRLLADAIRLELIQKTGAGRATFYRFR